MKARHILRTTIPSILIVLTLVVAIVANVMIPPNKNAINGFLGDAGTTTIKQPSAYNDTLDLQYNKANFTAEEMPAIKQALNEEIMGEGAVLLKNDGLMPFNKNTTFSFFGSSSSKLIGNSLYDIDVVQVYIQSPYTDYDKQNKVEKSAVQLVGFGKTALLQPGQSGTVTVTFDKEQLKAYDYTNAKTFILDAGDYYITAAHDSHNAINNVLAAKGYTTENGMTENGDTAMTALYTVSAMDSNTYSVSAAGASVTNQFDFINGGYQYLTRNDWQGTWPSTDGEVSTQISTWGNEINGSDGKSYTYTKTISAEDLAKLDGFDSLNPTDAASLTADPVYGAKNGLQLIDLRGKDYDDPMWDQLLDQLTPEDYQTIIATSGYGSAELKSVGKPFALDQDSATGISMDMNYCGVLVLAQTWNQELAARYGETIGSEAVLNGLGGWDAPPMNIHRLPFSGRNNEYYSEDGFLSGAMASATSRGASSKGLYTFIKHFALNDQENHRGDREGNFGVCTWSNEQAVREIYLLPFQMCIENDPITLNYVEEDGNGGYRNTSRDFPAVTAIMTAFNRIGYTWTGGCYPLITNVLRNE